MDWFERLRAWIDDPALCGHPMTNLKNDLILF